MVAGLALTLLMVCLLAGTPLSPAAGSAAPTPGLMTTSTVLTPPPTVYPPTQAGDGAQIYYYHCMTCHGDRGQGLTEAFRDSIGAPESNCWSARCHASNHADGSFVFPKNVPAVVAPGVLPGFTTAANLHDFIHKEMPFQAPGSLSEADYWALTAFLVQANGVDLGGRTLDGATAAQIHFGPQAAAQAPGTAWWPWAAGGAVLVALMALAWLLVRRMRRGER
jgi:cytochrome c